MSSNAALVVSIVSHGHGGQVDALLHDLARSCAASVSHVVLTRNVPEPDPAPPPGGWPFRVTLRQPAAPQGFGANHNSALAGCDEPLFCVLNPDIRLPYGDPFPALREAVGLPGTGCAYPVQLDEQQCPLDAEREWPTPLALALRHAVRRREQRADWVNAAFLLMPSEVYRRLGGFDERYFMYCEDVDLCLRLRLAGLALRPVPWRVVHATHRASRRQARHLGWHLSSLGRLWSTPGFWKMVRRSQARATTTTGQPH